MFSHHYYICHLGDLAKGKFLNKDPIEIMQTLLGTVLSYRVNIPGEPMSCTTLRIMLRLCQIIIKETQELSDPPSCCTEGGITDESTESPIHG